MALKRIPSRKKVLSREVVFKARITSEGGEIHQRLGSGGEGGVPVIWG